MSSKKAKTQRELVATSVTAADSNLDVKDFEIHEFKESKDSKRTSGN